ncbi:MAG: nodulation protein NfeD [Thermoproteota archaeon]|nr:nodulation protein NfeD [Thermoproteota archaeon]
MRSTDFWSFLGKHHHNNNNHQQHRSFFHLIAVFVAISISIVVIGYAIAAGYYSVFAQQQVQNQNDNRAVLWVDVKDFISSGTAEDIAGAIRSTSRAAESPMNFTVVVLALDTPGGSLDATFSIIDTIQRSSVPVVGYVYPQGTSAWSAGTIILLATDYAAMAPVTTIGSAQPVQGTEPINDTKVVNAVAEKAISLAELHGRNMSQAARFVTHNDNLTPEKAYERNVIDAIATNPQELLEVADGVSVTTFDGKKVLHTADAQIIKHESSLRAQLINFLSNPLIATTFMTMGFFVLIYGIISPGVGAEIAGAILIILGLLGQGLDINWGAFALLALGIGLVAYELYSPGFGAIGIAGIAVVAIGAGLMITQPVQPLLVTGEHLRNLTAISVITIAPFAGLLAIITYKVWKVKKRKPIQFVLQSDEGIALDPISTNTSGFVIVGGEYWKAKTSRQDEEINKGDKIKVVGKELDLLIVELLQNTGK